MARRLRATRATERLDRQEMLDFDETFRAREIERMLRALAGADRRERSFAVDAVARAVRRSRVALSEDPDQLAAQLHARLRREGGPSVTRLLTSLPEVAPSTWLRVRTWGMPWQTDLDTTLSLGGRVGALVFGEIDGNTVLALGIDDRVVLWDPRHGSIETLGLYNEGRRVTGLALAALAGRPVAVVAAGRDGRLTLIDLESGQRREADLPGFADSVAVGMYADRAAVAATGDGEAWVWNAETLERIPLSIDDPDDYTRRVEGTLAVAGQLAFHVSRVAAGVAISSIVDAASGQEMWRKDHEAMLQPGRASTEVDGQLVIAARSHQRGCVLVWGPHGSEPLGFDAAPLRALAMAAIDGRVVVAGAAGGGDRGIVSLRQAFVPRQLPPTIAPERLPVHGLALDPSGAVLALMSVPLEVVKPDPSGDLSLGVRDGDPAPALITRILAGHDAPFLFSTSDGGRQRLVTLRDLGAPPRKPGERYEVRRDRPIEWPATAATHAVVAGRAALVVGSYQGAVWFWDVERRALIAGPFTDVPETITVGRSVMKATTVGGRGPVTSLAVGLVGGRDLLATVCGGRVGLWDIASQAPLPSPDMGTSRAAAVALGVIAGRGVLITGSQRGMLTVWDAADCHRIARIRLDTGIQGVWVVRGAEVVGALTDDRVLHLFDLVHGGGSGE
jgi:hypothetical protein